jgi:acetolactate synthase small subunit
LSYSSTITITEVFASTLGGGSARILTLIGPGLPVMGAEWGAKLGMKTTWYPGNGEEATQQVLSPQELPSKWSGEWNRTRLGRTPCLFDPGTGYARPIIDPLSLWNALETLQRGGRRLRVIWAVDGTTPSSTGKVVREGRIEEVKFKPDRLQDIKWEANFEWMSRGGSTSRVTSTRSNSVTSNSAAYLNALNKLIAANALASAQQFNPSSLNLGQLEALANYPTTLTNSLARKVQQIQYDVGTLVDLAATVASQPVSVANRAISLARDTLSNVNSYRDTIGQVPVELLTLNDNVSALCQAVNTFFPQSDDADQLSIVGTSYNAQLLQQLQSTGGYMTPNRLQDPNNALQVYVARRGDTLPFISQKFYGNPDHAADIAIANGLPWAAPAFTTPTVIVIPVLSTLSATTAV